VRLRGVRLVVVPWLFRLPRMRRYDGYALRRTILLARADVSDDLVTHELVHVWQSQQKPVRHFWTWLTTRYEENPDELEARRAVAATRPSAESS
jgi:hypothetical protein